MSHTVLVLAFVAQARGMSAQPDSVIVVPDAVACGKCAVTTRTLAILGTRDGPGSLSGPIQSVSVDPLGRYWLLTGANPPFVFDASGRFITQVGRRGQGPGEYEAPTEALPLGQDSVLILDGGRATVLDSRFHIGRTVRLSIGAFPAEILHWPTSVIINGISMSRNAKGWPLHELSFADNIARITSSFGPENTGSLLGGAGRVMQHLAQPVRDGFWSADWGRYRLTHWAAPGQKSLTLVRHPSWFADETGGSPGSPDRPPEPGISAVFEDSTGLVWVFIKTPAPTWREAWPDNATGARGEINLARLAQEKLFQTVIEVLDPGTRRVLVRTTIPRWIIAVLPGRRAAAYVVDRDDVPRIEIQQLELHMSPAPSSTY